MSFILSQIIRKKVPEWNQKVWIEDDLYRLADNFQVPIVEDASAKAKGEYLILDGIPFILLKPGLKREMKLWVGLHEFGHHLLHYPVNHRFSRSVVRRMDREANFFASICLIPTFIFETKTLPEIQEEYNYPRELLFIRNEIYERNRN